MVLSPVMITGLYAQTQKCHCLYLGWAGLQNLELIYLNG
jgi:hypothetical protein